MTRFKKEYGFLEISKITSESIMLFLIKATDGQKQSTKKLKYSLLRSFFNFIKDSFDLSLTNPCDTPILRKTFKTVKGESWTILDRDIVDEIIFKTENPRNRLMLELMARGGMRVGEVLKLKVKNVHGRKLVLSEPKSGNQTEIVYIPKKVADRLREYIASIKIEDGNTVFPFGYTRAREIVQNAGKMINVNLNPHDLRRHAATYASRSGVPIEIVSKIILRHANLSTTQRYLGKVSDTEAIHWIDNLYR
ncbi:MAG: site-specific integrase [Proteobacteria bacterium]|nr:site-specific integrase [Pseudomonadota bacterium]MBU1542207.1 site-specific integrase [Pseudomonadota bacterium]MBU2431291.1 site-specific integrase [Pseudomonadota bacterium]MBU2482705.1 site-specific integrase [Pseudomonadota bacterium]